MKYFETRIRTAKFGLCTFQSVTDRRWVRSRPWTFGPGGRVGLCGSLDTPNHSHTHTTTTITTTAHNKEKKNQPSRATTTNTPIYQTHQATPTPTTTKPTRATTTNTPIYPQTHPPTDADLPTRSQPPPHHSLRRKNKKTKTANRRGGDTK